MKKGDIVRYATGPTALLKIEHINKIAVGGRFLDRLYGQQCMGGVDAAFAETCKPATTKDLQEWERHAPWRVTMRLTGQILAKEIDKPKDTSWPPKLELTKKKRRSSSSATSTTTAKSAPASRGPASGRAPATTSAPPAASTSKRRTGKS